MGTVGNAVELRKAADDLDVINAAGRQAYLQKAAGNLSEETLIQMMDEETWLTAEQCIQYGLADQFAEQEADMSNAGQILQKANLNLEQRIGIQRSLAAQLRDLVQKLPENPKDNMKQSKEPGPSIMQMLAGIFNV